MILCFNITTNLFYFFVQQKHSDLVFKDDEIGVFSDEEASFKSDMDEDL